MSSRQKPHFSQTTREMGHPAIGMVNGIEITVIYVDLDYVDLDADERRIISAWRSEPHERREYWKNMKGLSH